MRRGHGGVAEPDFRGLTVCLASYTAFGYHSSRLVITVPSKDPAADFCQSINSLPVEGLDDVDFELDSSSSISFEFFSAQTQQVSDPIELLCQLEIGQYECVTQTC
ncbi:hypothetical protein WISP_59745 [Willisornis vidua]|uniref:Uncharacterized protein n=1 Tax=Willisornis vidua TaxID=1566151 RepID=A0ABQ9DAZ5_9PASS|nr:hypothetical protein WISP_59745 [Willisornis vidua]